MAILWPFGKDSKIKADSNDATLEQSSALESRKFISVKEPKISIIQANKIILLNFNDDTRKTFKSNTSFVLFVNENDDFFVSIVKPTNFHNIFASLDRSQWRSCYVFTHSDLDFSKGKDLLFKNQLINVLQNTGHNVINSSEPQKVALSEIMKPFEAADYEAFWQEILNLLYSHDMQTVGHSLFFDKESLLKQKLFNFKDSDSRDNSIVPYDFIRAAKMSSTSSIVKYTIEDELGNSCSATTIHYVMIEWLRKLCSINSLKEEIIELASTENDELLYNSDSKIFQYYYGKGPYTIGLDEKKQGYVSLNIAQKRVKDRYSSDYLVKKHLSDSEMKKRLVAISAALGIKINLKEEVVSHLSEYDENFSQKISEEKAERMRKFSELVSVLKVQEEKDMKFLISKKFATNGDDKGYGKEKLISLLNSDVLSDESKQEFMKTLKDKFEDESEVSPESLKDEELSRSKGLAREMDSIIEELNKFEGRKQFEEVFNGFTKNDSRKEI